MFRARWSKRLRGLAPEEADAVLHVSLPCTNALRFLHFARESWKVVSPVPTLDDASLQRVTVHFNDRQVAEHATLREQLDKHLQDLVDEGHVFRFWWTTD